MLLVKGVIAALALACVLTLALAPARAAGGDVVLTDYRTDAVIDGSYSVTTLQAALGDRSGEPGYEGFAAAVQEQLDEALLGARTTAKPPPAPALTPVAAQGESLAGVGAQPLRRTQERTALGQSPAPAAVGLGLPEPPPPGATARVPWPFLALSALAGLLALSGLGASLYRRARRSSRLIPTA